MDKDKVKRAINREFKRIDQVEFGAKLDLGVKKCTRCKETKALSMFQHGRGYVDGYYKHCRACHYDVYVRNNHYKTAYGISQDEYIQMVVKVGNKCPICGSHHNPSKKQGRLCIDHCHKDGGIRGVICNDCNRALGSTKDNPEILRRLAEYIEGYYGNK